MHTSSQASESPLSEDLRRVLQTISGARDYLRESAELGYHALVVIVEAHIPDPHGGIRSNLVLRDFHKLGDQLASLVRIRQAEGSTSKDSLLSLMQHLEQVFNSARHDPAVIS